MVQTDRTEMTK